MDYPTVKMLYLELLKTNIYKKFYGGLLVKNWLAMQKTWVQLLGWEDPLEKEMAIHSNILAWTEEPGGLQPIGSQRVGHDFATKQQ